jgi:hypothetical protein
MKPADFFKNLGEVSEDHIHEIAGIISETSKEYQLKLVDGVVKDIMTLDETNKRKGLKAVLEVLEALETLE